MGDRITSAGLYHRDSYPPVGPARIGEEPVGVTELAAYLGITEQTVRVYAKTRQVPAFKLGNKWRFYLSDVRAHLTQPKPDQSPPSLAEGGRREQTR
jgi:excisionase family DNA binding protein